MSSTPNWCIALMHTAGAILVERLNSMHGVRSASYDNTGVLTVKLQDAAAAKLELDVAAVVCGDGRGGDDLNHVDLEKVKKLYLAYLLPRLEDVMDADDKKGAVERLQADFNKKRRIMWRRRVMDR